MPADGYEGLATSPPAQDDVSQETAEDDPYHVPAYFDLSEATTETLEEAELEFNPPLRHYAELRGGLPIGYVWLPPSSPEPIPREPLTIATEHKKTATFALSPVKKRKRATTVEYQALHQSAVGGAVRCT